MEPVTPRTELTRAQEKSRFLDALMWVLLGIAVIATVKFLEVHLSVSWSHWGLMPRTLHGLAGIVTMPFLHKDYEHLFGNCFALFILGLTLCHFYHSVRLRVVVYAILGGNLMVWLFARQAYHIGASGVVYSLSAYLFLAGVLRRDKASRGAALIVALLYGGEVWGIFPIQEGVSWEGHLCGALAGCYLALLYRNVDLPPDPPDPPDPPEDGLDDHLPWRREDDPIMGHD